MLFRSRRPGVQQPRRGVERGGRVPPELPLEEGEVQVLGMDELSAEDKLTVERARRIQRFLSQPFQVAEVFTGIKGVLVSMKDTLRSFQEVLDGKHDDLPEAAFYMVSFPHMPR